MTRDEKLESLGYSLSKTLSRGAIYQPVVIDGTTAYVSGCVPFDGDKNLASKGKVPSQVLLHHKVVVLRVFDMRGRIQHAAGKWRNELVIGELRR